MQVPHRRSAARILGLSVVALALAATTACSGGANAAWQEPGAPGASGEAGGSTASRAPGEFTITPAADSADVPVLSQVTVTPKQATLTSVTVVNPDGKQVDGAFDDSHSTWHTTGDLGYGKKYTVTATGTGGVPVNGATIRGEVVTSAGGATTATVSVAAGSKDGQYTATLGGTAPSTAGTYSVKFWVDNASSGSTGVLDSGDTQTSSSWTLDALPTASGDTANALTIPSPSTATPVQSGKATSLSYTVKATQTGGGTTIALSGLAVALDATVNGTTTRYQATTGSDGTATFSVPVTAAQATGTTSATAYVSESSATGDGISSLSSAANTDYTFTSPAVNMYAPATVQAAVGGTVTIPVTVQDQFDNKAGAGDTLSYTISGRNGGSSGVTKSATVGSDGVANLTYTDTGTGPAASGADTVTVTDVNHSGYALKNQADGSSLTSVSVAFLNSLTPSKIVWAGTPTTNQDTGVSSTAYNASGAYTLTVENSDGTALSNQPVAVHVTTGFVGGTSDVSPGTGSATYSTTSASNGTVAVYVGSITPGVQTISATSGQATQAVASTITYHACDHNVTSAAYCTATPYNLSIAPATSNIAVNDQSNVVVTVTDKYGNPLAGESANLAITGPANFASGVSPQWVTTGSAGTATVTLRSGATSGSGSVTASATGYPTTAASDATVALADTATAKYTVGAATVSQVKVAGIKGVGVGGTEKIAVRVWNSDGSLAAGATVNVKVTGANTATGTATTGPNGELGWFSYTAKNAGTDHVTATIDGKTATTTVTISSAISSHLFHPVAQANGTFLYSVQTIPATAGARVNLFAVYHPGKADQALFHAGNSTTNAAGRAARATSPGYLVHGHFKHYRAGQTYVLVAKIVGSAGQSNMSSATAK